MKALTWFAYYYGTLAGFLLLYEIVVVRETGSMFNPLNQPGITVPLMIGTALLMILPTVYFKLIKPDSRESSD